jgi:multisubunit Na+/H+ antiporter MnhC subunit
MNAILTAAVIGTALLALTIWVEIRERRVAPGEGEYRTSGPPRS